MVIRSDMVDLETVILNGVSQMKKDKYHMISLTLEPKKWYQ